MSKYCNTCCYWRYMYDYGDKKYGACDNMYVPDEIRLIQNEELISATEEPVLLTSNFFGCVMHQVQDGYPVVEIPSPNKK